MEIDLIFVELESILLQKKTFFEFCYVYVHMYFINVYLCSKAYIKFH